MKKVISILIFLSLTIIFSFGQEEEFFNNSSPKENEQSKRKLDKWSFGGNFWLHIGTSSYIEVSPLVLYKVTPKLMIGPGFTYFYEKSKYYSYETSSYGPRAVLSYTLFSNLDEKINLNIGNIILYTEFEYLNLELFSIDNNRKFQSEGRTWDSSFLVGGGIFQPLGKRGGISLVVLYNVIESDYTRHTNPVIRIGFNF